MFDDDNEEELSFASHEDVARIVRTMERNLLTVIPPMVWVGQSEQLATAVRNHVDEIGGEVTDRALMGGMLYGSMLTLNLESQVNEISPASIMLVTVLLNLFENPDFDLDANFESLRKALEPEPEAKPQSVLRRIFRRP